MSLRVVFSSTLNILSILLQQDITVLSAGKVRRGELGKIRQGSASI
jgi:hypothetical protein